MLLNAFIFENIYCGTCGTDLFNCGPARAYCIASQMCILPLLSAWFLSSLFFWSCWRCLEKKGKHIIPNGGFMVIYRGKARKTSPETNPSFLLDGCFCHPIWQIMSTPCFLWEVAWFPTTIPKNAENTLMYQLGCSTLPNIIVATEGLVWDPLSWKM